MYFLVSKISGALGTETFTKLESILCRLTPPWLIPPPTTVERDCMFPHPPLSFRVGQRGMAAWSDSVGVGWDPGRAMHFLRGGQNHASDHSLKIRSWPRPDCFVRLLIRQDSCSTQTRALLSLFPPHPPLHLPVHGSDPGFQDSEAGLIRTPPTEEGAGHPKKPFQHLRKSFEDGRGRSCFWRLHYSGA